MAQNVGAEAARTILFDIDTQPLVSALDLYSTATGVQVVYDGALAIGRTSTQIKGAMIADRALERLLDGTDLVAIYAAPDVFTLRPKPPAPARKTATIDDYKPYLGVVQASVEDAFCRQALIAPGAYHVRLQFWIGTEGQVLSPRLLDTASDSDREQSIVRTLADLAIERAPPVGMPQPIIMEISRRPPQETGDCGAWRRQGPKFKRALAP